MPTAGTMHRPNNAILTRRDLVLALTEARIAGERTLAGAPEYARGYADGITVAIEIVRALDNMDRAINPKRIERR